VEKWEKNQKKPIHMDAFLFYPAPNFPLFKFVSNAKPSSNFDRLDIV